MRGNRLLAVVATESRSFFASGFFLAGTREFLSPFVSVCVSFGCLLLSHLPLRSLWFPGALQPTCLIPSQPAVLPLSDRAWWTPPAQLLARSSSSSRSSASSGSTELRMSPSADRDPWCNFWRFLQGEYRRLIGDTGTPPPRVYRPTVTIFEAVYPRATMCPLRPHRIASASLRYVQNASLLAAGSREVALAEHFTHLDTLCQTDTRVLAWSASCVWPISNHG